MCVKIENRKNGEREREKTEAISAREWAREWEREKEEEEGREEKRREEKRAIATRVLLSEAMARISKRPSVSCFFLVLLIAFCLGSLPCQAEAPKATTSSGTSGEGKVVEITDRNYDALVHDGPWMIVVSASWCPHCKQLQPTWEKLAEKLEGKTKVGKIDGPEQKIVTKRLHIKGFPTIFHIDKKGKIRDYGEKSRDLEKVKQQKKKSSHSHSQPPYLPSFPTLLRRGQKTKSEAFSFCFVLLLFF